MIQLAEEKGGGGGGREAGRRGRGREGVIVSTSVQDGCNKGCEWYEWCV